jgi:CDGSH-type Zn-finger protein
MSNPEIAEIRAYEDGPLIVRGNFELRDENGDLIDPGRATIALCRCGRSALKPLCDGTHTLVKKRR